MNKNVLVDINTTRVVDMKVSGASSLAGGEFKSLRISGSARINGSIICEDCHCSGSCRLDGDLEAESVRSSGSVKISGRLIAGEVHTSSSLCCKDADLKGELHSSGSSVFEGDLKATRIRSSGALNCGGNLHCEQMSTSGKCTVAGNLEAETFECTGSVEVPGLLNAETLYIYPCNRSKVGSIGGSNIRILIRDKGGWNFLGRFTPESQIEVGTIEGDRVELEATKAEIVRGRDVKIGKGCMIDLVEYTGTLTAEAGTVKRSVKV